MVYKSAGAKDFSPLPICKTPQAGFEPATNRLTVDRSTAELLRIVGAFFPNALSILAQGFGFGKGFENFF